MKNLKKIITTGVALVAIGIGANLGIQIYQGMNPKRTAVYEYAINSGVEKNVAAQLEKKLSSELQTNYQSFIETISGYDSELQNACANSDILENKKISDKELENVQNKKLNDEGKIENPREIYAVIANSSGSSNAERHSEENKNYSLITLNSVYKFLKEKGVSDDNIELFVYNNKNIFETKEYKSLLEKKVNGIPSNEDEIIVDGKATKSNFLDAIRNSGADSNDKLLIVYHSPNERAKAKYEGTTDNIRDSVRFNNESISPSELTYAIQEANQNCREMTIIENLGGNLPLAKKIDVNTQYMWVEKKRAEEKLKGILIISSPNTTPNSQENILNNEIFTISLLRNTINGNSLKQSFKKSKTAVTKTSIEQPSAVYLDGFRKSAEECPWFDKALLN